MNAQEPHLHSLRKLVAFLMRYAHQPLSEVLSMTRRDVTAFAKVVGELIEEEHKTSNAPRD